MTQAKMMVNRRQDEVEMISRELKKQRDFVSRLEADLTGTIKSLTYWQKVYSEEQEQSIRGLAHAIESLTASKGG